MTQNSTTMIKPSQSSATVIEKVHKHQPLPS